MIQKETLYSPKLGADSQKSQKDNFLEKLPIISVLLLSTALMFFRIDYRGLWIDEFISILDAQKTQFNKGRFLYYPILKVWMLVNSSDAWLRSISVIFALGSIYVVYRLGRNLFDKKVGLLSALMLGLSPLFINHAQEVRYYCMSVFLGIVGSFFMILFIQNPSQKINLVQWIIFRALAVLTTPLTLALIIPDLFIACLEFRSQRRNLFRFFIGFIALIALVIPTLLSIYRDSGSHRLNPPIPGLVDVLREIRILTVFPNQPSIPFVAFSLKFHAIATTLLILFTATSLVVSIIKRQKSKSKKEAWILSYALLPIGIVFVFSHVFYSIWITRYIMMSLPYILMAIVLGLEKLWQTKIRFLVLAFTISYCSLLGYGLYTYYTTPNRYIGASDSYRSIAHVIEKNDQEGDTIVWSSIHNTTLPLTHYYKGSAEIYLRHVLKDTDESEEAFENWVDDLPQFKSRLWVIYQDESPQLYKELESRFHQVEKYKTVKQFSVFLVSQ